LVKSADLTKEEVIQLTRDHLGRQNPDELLMGFIPVWAIVIYAIAATMLLISIISGVCWVFGCRNTHKPVAVKNFD
jgi:hypothetical protein